MSIRKSYFPFLPLILLGCSGASPLTSSYPSTSSSSTLPTITSSGSIAPATEGSRYSAALSESGGTGALTWSLAGGTSLPAGLTLNSNGTLTGTPTGPAGTNFTFSVQVTDSVAHTSPAVQLSMSINNYPPPTFSVSTLSNGAIGQNYNQSVSILGGHAPFTIVAAGLPSGLATTANGNPTDVTGNPVQASAITFVGTPTALGNHFAVSAVVSDSSNPAQLTSVSYSMDVLPSGTPPQEIIADASQLGPVMNKDQLGVNLAYWLPDSFSPSFVPLFSSAGVGLIRWPGGIWRISTIGRRIPLVPVVALRQSPAPSIASCKPFRQH